MAAFQEILDVLPGRLQTLDFSDVQELRLRVGQAPNRHLCRWLLRWWLS